MGQDPPPAFNLVADQARQLSRELSLLEDHMAKDIILIDYA
jgi:hypothetical protein